MSRTALRLFLAVLTLGLARPSVRAEMIPWSAAAGTNPRWVLADNQGTGGVFMTTQPWQGHSGTQTILGTLMLAFSSAPPSHPDQLHNDPSTLTVSFRDDQSGATGQMLFHGVL